MVSSVSSMPPSLKHVSGSYMEMEPPSGPLSNHPSKSILMPPSAEPSSLTPLQLAEKSLAIQKTTPPETESITPQTRSKRVWFDFYLLLSIQPKSNALYYQIDSHMKCLQ